MKKFVLIPILSMLLTNFITIFSSQLDSNEDEQKSIIFETQNEILKQESDNKLVYEGAYTFRIYAYSPTIGIHNKGRISIGNMALYTVG